MNIVRLSCYALPHRGGVEISVQETSKRLVARGHNVWVICYRPVSGGPLVEMIDGVQYIRREFGVGVSDILKSLSDFNIDLLSYEDFPAFESGQLKSIARAKFDLYYAHGWEGVCPPNPQVVQIRQMVNKKCDYTIEVGAFISKWYETIPDFVSYGGFPEDWSNRNEEYKSGVISWVGRLAPDTGYEHFCRALASFLEKTKLYSKVDIFGDGPLKSITPVHPNVVVHGMVNNPMLYVLSDFVMCSGYMSMLEALSLKKTPIAFYDNPLKRDYLNHFVNVAYIVGSVGQYLDLLIQVHAGNLCRKSDEKFLAQNSWTRTVDVIELMAGGKFEKRIKLLDSSTDFETVEP